MSRLPMFFVALVTLVPASSRSEPHQGFLIAAQLQMNSLIEDRCGDRLDVVWVDERGQNPPCYMAYSNSCVEAQTPHPQSCLVMMKNVQQ
ncbi:hypothetical protein [Chitinibacter sp. S2-10]|uniref:hypothetical protein n=1 Tax=Chitinibacter sp. S2-10 TaxID=3373597 RepID=UPI0039777F62